ncbi:hypothetical protein N0V83_002771 [Neocucurbitaria cava]|uniref:F-box domain-containing protein n=1 Tax=Neocucurbitaria cava TaxID=798079 RepID=A0A9W8YCE9_9PLEO|nr:hypothetical protein N0V83_002771 [Neocucurbitaria cava]
MDLRADAMGERSDIEAQPCFLGLPGELRNDIYEFLLLDQDPIRVTMPLISSCRQVRKEYMPLYFQRQTICLPIYRVQSFFETYFLTNDTKFIPPPICSVKVSIATDKVTAIDMKWLAGFLLQRPKISITFDNDVEYSLADDLKVLLDISKSNDVWRDGLTDYASVKLISRISKYPWEEDAEDLFWDWYLELVVKQGVLTNRPAYGSNSYLPDFGLYKLSGGPGNRAAPFAFLRIVLERQP